MRVLLDATAIPANLGGVGRYVDDLVPELLGAGVRLAMAVQERDVEHFRAKAPRVRLLPVPARLTNRGARLAWEQTGLPALIRRIRPDVLHSPHYTYPAAHQVPVVVTLHDATFFSHPQAHTRLKQVFFTTAIRRAVRGADALVVPSAATRDETLRFVDGDASRFHVAYHGVDTRVFHPVDDAERERVAASLGLAGRRYIGFLGTLEPRKNVPNLIEGWVRAFHDADEPPALVLAGGKGWDEGIEPALAAVPSHMTVLRPGYLPLEDLPGFLSGCEVLAYPSIAEGFGLPVLEAMACGAAVLTTRETSLPEVGGDAVAYCGLDAEAIARGLVELDADPARRRALGRAAQDRAVSEQFTWRASARAHIEAYRAALSSRRR
ncbi:MULTISPECIES: glycosyltransferase family 1 protein [unclassified Actinomyces]|uniref:glycosyltransferase family 4 protein n=1 Tax=unclassified Actinomyces TaxID=2609248 RepID=UPI0020170D41|nr:MULTISPECIES: glycosyltransferase family 1 protein [unclassified Actinomyces]MCL3776998.1 glycosyltransferase family 4 protein [Actinomyces sp. AC-20-1]MCL3789053.1 glycosyltransferase family 4 protein [Actinomyces sp. 187325]MCL3791433.1 glycosyltransferase family 4 protein [Actinomyces sp. 186855]MCL3794037.1 glycosyltransferase family 4 protein [Actinomyces sp. 217892]